MVRACAGSGKTRLLAAKFLTALFWQGSPKGVVAITFTEKAAQELKARAGRFLEAIAGASSEKALENSAEVPWAEIRSALNELKLASPGPSGWPELRRRAGELARSAVYPGLEIGTIHGYAKKFLERYPFEALGGLLTHFDPAGGALERAVEESCAGEAIKMTQIFDGVSYTAAVKVFQEALEMVKRGWSGSVVNENFKEKGWRDAGEVLPFSVEHVLKVIESSREEGYLDYDLLLYWLDIFLSKAPPAIWPELRAQAKYLLIDELQDTDPLQLRILSRLAAGSSTGAPESGRLFLVGDPFQSIYSFRGAAPELIFGSSFQKGFVTWELKGNKRSRSGILDFVNKVYEGDVPGYEPMHSPWSREDGPGLIWWHSLPASEVSLKSEDRRRLEARHAAQTIAQLAAEHGWPWNHFAILLRKMSHGWHYYDELRKLGIPAVLGASPSALLRLSAVSRELYWLVALWRRPQDTNARAYLAHSPLCGGGQTADRFQKLEAGLELLKGESLQDSAVGTLIERMVTLFDLEREALDLGLEEVQALEAARSLAWKAVDLADYLELLGRRMKVVDDHDEEDEEDGAAEAPWQSDSVKIATIHKVKGLEFPCVLLAGLGDWSLRNSSSRILWDPATGRTALALASPAKGKFVGTDEVLYDSLKDSLRRSQLAEEERILYVALTRAQRALVIFDPGSQTKNRAGSYSLPMQHLLAKARTLAQDLECSACRDLPPIPVGGDAASSSVAPLIESLSDVSFLASPASGMEPPALIYASQHEWTPSEELPAGAPSEVRAETLGRILHGVLERIPWKTRLADFEVENPLKDSVAAETAQYQEPAAGAATQALTILKNFAASPLWAELSSKRLLGREIPVSYLEGGSLIVGRADLIYSEAGTLVIADYKTDAPNPDVYRGQGEKYLKAFQGYARRAGFERIRFELILIRESRRIIF